MHCNNRHLIEFHGVTKEYTIADSHIWAVRDMTFHIDDGEFVSIMGQSGSGKSTLLSILGGLNHPSKGKVVVDTLDVYGLTPEQRADFRSEYIGFIFQSFQLIPYLTVKENVKLPMAVTGIRSGRMEKMALAVLERVGLGNKSNRLPDQLSGGEQERVAIARAIVNNPPILLADEPTGNLDSMTAAKVMALLRQLNLDGQTIVMVTHNPGICEHTNRIIQVQDGICLAN
jgi:putative ABC transport system ATP-binding protein